MKLRESKLWPDNAAPASAFCGESERTKVIAAHGLEALADDPELTALTRFAALLCAAPVSLVTLVEPDRQRFLARTGVEIDDTPRSTSFCAYAMMGGGLMVVPDATLDARFAGFELVTGDFGLRFYAGAPLTSVEGAPIGAFCVIDTAPRPQGLSELQQQGLLVLAQTAKRRIQALREVREIELETTRRSKHFRTLGDWLPDIIWSSDSDGRFDYFNSRWESVTGSNRPEDAGSWSAFIHEEEREAVDANWSDCVARGADYENEYRLRQADGGWRWIISRALPVKDELGAVVRWYGTLTDIDERRRAADSSGTIARELAHRIKNVFALISGLVSVRTRGREDLREFGEDLVGSINALSKAQDLVQPSGGAESSDVLRLVRVLLEPFTEDDSGRIAVEGDTAPVGARAATPLALVLHEMATNSVKYGALSVAGGRIAIALRLEGEDLTMAWVESGGPAPVAPPPGQRAGFGTRLIDMSVTSQLEGEVARDWRDTGLAVTLRLPCKALAT